MMHRWRCTLCAARYGALPHRTRLRFTPAPEVTLSTTGLLARCGQAQEPLWHNVTKVNVRQRCWRWSLAVTVLVELLDDFIDVTQHFIDGLPGEGQPC